MAEQAQTPEQVQALADAMWQLLDDMGKHGTSACVAAKAYARVAYEPFREGVEYDDWMWLSEALEIVASIERQPQKPGSPAESLNPAQR